VYYSVDEDALDHARDLLTELKASMRLPHLADHCEDQGC
jgi:hypothetical protein